MAAQITRAESVALATAPGQRLRPDAAAAWDASVRAFGSTVLLTDSLRPYDVQERIFRDRYRVGNHAGKAGYTSDVRYWQGQPWTRRAGTAAAAVPGTSNHGSGLAVDVKTKRASGDPGKPAAVVFTGYSDPDRAAFLKVAAAHGWDDDEGRSVGEPWHLTYYPDRDQHRTTTKGDITVNVTLPRLATGSTGAHVRLLQGILNVHGAGRAASGKDLIEDGDFGPATEKALRAHQASHKIDVDGIAGADSWRTLLQDVPA